ncbi:MAG TPA: hypothetical protein VF203_13975 [Burkholderiales bacterium]
MRLEADNRAFHEVCGPFGPAVIVQQVGCSCFRRQTPDHVVANFRAPTDRFGRRYRRILRRNGC